MADDDGVAHLDADERPDPGAEPLHLVGARLGEHHVLWSIAVAVVLALGAWGFAFHHHRYVLEVGPGPGAAVAVHLHRPLRHRTVFSTPAAGARFVVEAHSERRASGGRYGSARERPFWVLAVIGADGVRHHVVRGGEAEMASLKARAEAHVRAGRAFTAEASHDPDHPPIAKEYAMDLTFLPRLLFAPALLLLPLLGLRREVALDLAAGRLVDVYVLGPLRVAAPRAIAPPVLARRRGDEAAGYRLALVDEAGKETPLGFGYPLSPFEQGRLVAALEERGIPTERL